MKNLITEIIVGLMIVFTPVFILCTCWSIIVMDLEAFNYFTWHELPRFLFSVWVGVTAGTRIFIYLDEL